MVLLLTARVLRRHYLFRPESETNEAFAFFLGVFAEKYGLEVMAGVLMSTHYHLVVRDKGGRRPDFIRDLNRQMALFVQRKWGWEGKVFQEKPNQLVLFSRAAVAQKIGYVLANPVASGSVESPEEWPGFRTEVAEMGAPGGIRSVRKPRLMKPKMGSRRKSVFPEKAQLVLAMPAFLKAPFERDVRGQLRKAQEVQRLVRVQLEEAVAREVARAKEKAAKQGGRLGGIDLSTLDPFKQAVAYEPYGELTPKVSLIGLDADEIRAALDAEVGFQVAHAQCRRRLMAGEKDIRWPDGTWLARVQWGQKASCPPFVFHK